MKLTFPPKKLQIKLVASGYLYEIFLLLLPWATSTECVGRSPFRDPLCSFLDLNGRILVAPAYFVANLKLVEPGPGAQAMGGIITIFSFLFLYPLVFWILGIIIWNIYKSRKNEEI